MVKTIYTVPVVKSSYFGLCVLICRHCFTNSRWVDGDLLRREVFERYQCRPFAPGYGWQILFDGRIRRAGSIPIERLAAIGLIGMVIPVRRVMAEIAAQAFLYDLDSQGNLT